MRRTCVIFTVLALALSVVPSAGAAVNCDKLPDHPKCPGDPGGGDDLVGGLTCVERAQSDYIAAEDGDFDILGQGAGDYCIDVSEVVPGNWQVDFTVTQGTLRSLIVQVRDSVAPGDLCIDQRIWGRDKLTAADGPQNWNFFVDAGDWVNACGVDWAEQIDGQDWWDEDVDWKHPLVFLVWASGSSDLAVDFHVSVP